MRCGAEKQNVRVAGSFFKLMEAVEALFPSLSGMWISLILMPIEDVFSIKGRGTDGEGRV